VITIIAWLTLGAVIADGAAIGVPVWQTRPVHTKRDGRDAALEIEADRDRLANDLASLGHWYCPNCGGLTVTDVEDDTAMCAACGHQSEWSEPDTLTRAKAYAERLRKAKNRAFAERDAARGALDRVRALADDAKPAIGIGCLATTFVTDSGVPLCNGMCGGHRTTGWTLDPEAVRAALADADTETDGKDTDVV